MSDQIQSELEKRGLYAGNVLLELDPDSKGVKPVIKVNNLATKSEMDAALNNFSYLLTEAHAMMYESKLPITYLQLKPEKTAKEKAKEADDAYVLGNKGEVKLGDA